MKFLLELVPCCGSPTPKQRKVPGLPTPPRPHELEDDDDVTSLVPPPPPPQRRTKRVRTTVDARSISRSLSVEWSPSLGVISENRVVTTTAKGLATGQRNVTATELAGSVTAETGRRTSGSGGNSAADSWRAPDRDRRRREREDYELGRTTLPTTMIPAFSPTPFLF